jgi:hypothetical protein
VLISLSIFSLTFDVSCRRLSPDQITASKQPSGELNKTEDQIKSPRATAIAVDDVTHTVLTPVSNDIVMAYDTNGRFKGAASNGDPIYSIAAKSGYACMSQPAIGVVSIWNLHDLLSGQLESFSLGKAPGHVWMADLRHEGLVCVVYDQAVTSVSVVSIPSIRIVKTIRLSGITPLDQLGPFQGGWRLIGFGRGPSAGIAGVLSFADKKIAFVDLQQGKQISVAEFQWSPFEAAEDIKHGRVVTALFGMRSPRTHFSSVDPKSGHIRDLRSTTELFPAGLLVTLDGNSIVVFSGKDRQVLPNR